MLQGVRGCVVGTEFGIKISENSDANGITHASIVLERMKGVVRDLTGTNAFSGCDSAQVLARLRL
jgi:uncharacterized membrane protein